MNEPRLDDIHAAGEITPQPPLHPDVAAAGVKIQHPSEQVRQISEEHQQDTGLKVVGENVTPNLTATPEVSYPATAVSTAPIHKSGILQTVGDLAQEITHIFLKKPIDTVNEHTFGGNPFKDPHDANYWHIEQKKSEGKILTPDSQQLSPNTMETPVTVKPMTVYTPETSEQTNQQPAETQQGGNQ